jgi:hypothetical protein
MREGWSPAQALPGGPFLRVLRASGVCYPFRNGSADLNSGVPARSSHS